MILGQFESNSVWLLQFLEVETKTGNILRSVAKKQSSSFYFLFISRVSVSRSLRTLAEPNRPQDWLSPRNCALQYNSLLEKTGAHKRKRGERHPSSGSTDSLQGETAGEIILRQLTHGMPAIVNSTLCF